MMTRYFSSWTFPCALLVTLALAEADAHGAGAGSQMISNVGAQIEAANQINVSWITRLKPDRISFADGKPIQDRARILMIRREVSRLLAVGTPAVAGRDGLRDNRAYWCAARIEFVVDSPDNSLTRTSEPVLLCGRPGRFMAIAKGVAVELEQPRGEITTLLSLSGIEVLPDCIEPPRPPLGHDYEDFESPCW